MNVPGEWGDTCLEIAALLFTVSKRLFRSVRKDCTVSIEGKTYLVPNALVGENVTVCLKGREVRIFADDKLVMTYVSPEGRKKGELLGDRH